MAVREPMNIDTDKQKIPEATLRGQAWKHYCVVLAWPAYLFFLPWVWSRSPAAGIVFTVFPGIYLFTWMGFLMHECWHRYVPNVPNGAFYQIFSWLLLTDPQVYRLLHGTHHYHVNSWQDAEFHPFGEIKSRPLRIAMNIAEITLGIAALVIAQTFVMIGNPAFRRKYRVMSLLVSILVWIVYLGGIGWAAHHVFSVPALSVAVSYILFFWIAGALLHHSQLVEHGNLFIAGDWNERNIKTRNLRVKSPAERVFLFMTHGDSREHVLHHVLVSVHSRPFPGRIPLPANAAIFTMGDYGRVLRDMITGRESAK